MSTRVEEAALILNGSSSRDYYLSRLLWRDSSWCLFRSRLTRQLSDDHLRHTVTPIYEPSGKNVQLFGFLFNRLCFFIYLSISLFQRAMGAAIKVVTLIEQATKLQRIKLRRNIIPLTEFRYSARLWYYSTPRLTWHFYNIISSTLSQGKMHDNPLAL